MSPERLWRGASTFAFGCFWLGSSLLWMRRRSDEGVSAPQKRQDETLKQTLAKVVSSLEAKNEGHVALRTCTSGTSLLTWPG